jgi:hypothetical protein
MASPILDEFASPTGNIDGRTPSPTDNGNNWVSETGVDITASGDVSFSGPNQSALVEFSDADQFVECTWNCNGEDNELDLFARCSASAEDPKDGYHLQMRQSIGDLRIREKSTFVSSTLGSAYSVPGGINSSQTYKVGLKVQGTTLTAYLDDVQIIQVTDSTHTSRTKAGFKHNDHVNPGGSLDNFSARTPNLAVGTVPTIDIASVAATIVNDAPQQTIVGSVAPVLAQSFDASIFPGQDQIVSSSVGVAVVSGIRAFVVTGHAPITDEFATPTGEINGRTPVPDSNGNTWVAETGVTISSSGKVEFSGANKSALIEFNDPDQFAQCTWNCNGGDNELDLFVRSSASAEDPKDGYHLRLVQSDGNLRIREKSDFISKTIGSIYSVPGGINSTTTYKLGLKVQGTTLTAYLDDVQIIQVTDTTHVNRSKTGFKHNDHVGSGGILDDFSVRTPNLVVAAPKSIGVSAINAEIETKTPVVIKGTVATIAVASINAVIPGDQEITGTVGSVTAERVNATITVVTAFQGVIGTVGTVKVFPDAGVVINVTGARNIHAKVGVVSISKYNGKLSGIKSTKWVQEPYNENPWEIVS